MSLRRFFGACGFTFGLCLAFSTTAAGIDRLVAISYETQSGWSTDVVREVEFVTGREIATHGSGSAREGYYALIWLGRGQVALVELPRTHLSVTGSFERQDFRTLFGFNDVVYGTQVNESHAQRWRIRGKGGARFIDPREKSQLY
jgi:hypothetical protein